MSPCLPSPRNTRIASRHPTNQNMRLYCNNNPNEHGHGRAQCTKTISSIPIETDSNKLELTGTLPQMKNAANNDITPKSDTNSANSRKNSPWTVDGTPRNTTIAIHKGGHVLISTILHKLTETATLHQNGKLMTESPERPKCRRIIEVRPQTTPSSDQKGPPEEPNQKKSKVQTPTEI